MTKKQKITLAMFILVLSILISSAILASEAGVDTSIEDKQLFSESEQAINELQSAGIKTQRTQSILEMLKKSIQEKDSSTARKLHYQIITLKKSAVESQEKIKVIEDLLISGESRWLEMRNTKNMLILAKSAFDREDFATSIDRASQAQTIAQVELKSISWLYVIYKYWWLIIILGTASAFTGRIIYQNLKTSNITKNINDLTTEEINIVHLMKETQEKHFNRRELSPSQFHKAMYEYQHRLSKIRREVAHLRAERIKIYSAKKEIEFLQKEEKHVYDLIKKAQEDHFVKKLTGETEYQLLMDEFHERLAEIEESITKLQYLRDQEVVLKRIQDKRRPSKSDLLDKKIENIILPEDKVKKYRQYSELKESYEKQREESELNKEEHRTAHEKNQKQREEQYLRETRKETEQTVKIKANTKSKEDMLSELKEVYKKEDTKQ